MEYKYENGLLKRHDLPEWHENETQEQYLTRIGFETTPAIRWGDDDSSFGVEIYEGGENGSRYCAELCIGGHYKYVYIADLPNLLAFLRYVEPIRRMTAEDDIRMEQFLEKERHKAKFLR